MVVRPRRGVYSLAQLAQDHRLAVALCGARSHRTAAVAHGFAIATVPDLPEICVPPGRNLSPELRRQARIRWRPLSKTEQSNALTSPLTTVVSCLRDLGGAEGLAVADSAVRAGRVTVEEVVAALRKDRGPRVRAARLLAERIDPGAESALESVLRFVAHDVEGLALSSQVRISDGRGSARVDLADPALGIVAEADSFTWHGSRRALAKDAQRYNWLVGAGWRVLRFSYEAVFFDPEEVQEHLRRVVEVQTQLAAAGVRPWRRCAVGHVTDQAA